MQNVALSEPLYDQAARAAAAKGLSLETFIAEAVERSLHEEFNETMESFFTHSVISEIMDAALEARTGPNLSPDQVEAHFNAKKQSWLANQPN